MRDSFSRLKKFVEECREITMSDVGFRCAIKERWLLLKAWYRHVIVIAPLAVFMLFETYRGLYGLFMFIKLHEAFYRVMVFAARLHYTVVCVCAFLYRAATVSVEMYSLKLSRGHAHAQNNLLWCSSGRLEL